MYPPSKFSTPRPHKWLPDPVSWPKVLCCVMTIVLECAVGQHNYFPFIQNSLDWGIILNTMTSKLEHPHSNVLRLKLSRIALYIFIWHILSPFPLLEFLLSATTSLFFFIPGKNSPFSWCLARSLMLTCQKLPTEILLAFLASHFSTSGILYSYP